MYHLQHKIHVRRKMFLLFFLPFSMHPSINYSFFPPCFLLIILLLSFLHSFLPFLSIHHLFILLFILPSFQSSYILFSSSIHSFNSFLPSIIPLLLSYLPPFVFSSSFHPFKIFSSCPSFHPSIFSTYSHSLFFLAYFLP